MRSLIIALIVTVAATARADDGVHASFGGSGITSAGRYFALTGNVLRIGLLDREGRGWEISGMEWESLDVDGDDHVGLSSPFSTTEPRTRWSALGFRYQRDADAWGAYAQVEVVDWPYGEIRYLAPRVGVRIGGFDDAAVIGEVRLAGVVGLGPELHSPLGAIDVRLRTTALVLPWLRLETRSRYRDATAVDGARIRDVQTAVGIELSGGRKDGFRMVPGFIGIGVHRLLADPAATAAAAAPPTDDVVPPPAQRGWQVMVELDLEVGESSARSLW